MKNTILLMLLLLSLSAYCFSQTSAKNKPVKIKITSTKQPIVFCDFPGDTLTYDQILNCKTLSVKNTASLQIVSFEFSYLTDKGFFVIKGSGNILNQIMLDALDTFKSKLTKIAIEHVMVNDGSKTSPYGYRLFYIKH